MATKAKKPKFVKLSELHTGERVYRITFRAPESDYSSITEEIEGYADILEEEVEIEE